MGVCCACTEAYHQTSERLTRYGLAAQLLLAPMLTGAYQCTRSTPPLHAACHAKAPAPSSTQQCFATFRLCTVAYLTTAKLPRQCKPGPTCNHTQVRTIERVCEIPHEGPFCDLMWSDPEDIDTWAVSPRGAGWLFGARVTAEFNRINGLELVCRAHQLVQEGLKFMFTGEL